MHTLDTSAHIVPELLFIIYVNDIFSSTDSNLINLFAVDILISVSGQDQYNIVKKNEL